MYRLVSFGKRQCALVNFFGSCGEGGRVFFSLFGSLVDKEAWRIS